jgi:hypothetical protein
MKLQIKKWTLLTSGMALGIFGLMEMAYSASSLGPTNCPDIFVGKVRSVKDETSGADNPLKKIRVEFDGLGKKGGTREIKTLKHGENDFRKGDTYKIGLRSGHICEITKLSDAS